jgi:hypothetical protein
VNFSFFLRLAGVPYVAQRLGHAGPGPESGVCFTGPRFPSVSGLGSTASAARARLCSAASRLLCRSQTSPGRDGIYGTTADVGALI